jgi:hypothetical protein
VDGWASAAERFMIAGRSIASGERRQSASQDQNGAIQPFVGPKCQHSGAVVDLPALPASDLN